MAFCSHCGAKLARKAAFCSGCGIAVAELTSEQSTSAESKPAEPLRPSSSSESESDEGLTQSVSNSILQKLGLEIIKGFSLADFFSEVFRKHDPAEVERRLAVGTPETTPPLDASMSVLPNPWIFFRVLCYTILAYIIFYLTLDSYPTLKLVPGLLLVGTFAVPFSILILFFELNTPRNISVVMIIKLLVIGGAFSLLLSLFLFSKTAFLQTAFGASAAGFVEETGKLAALLFVLRKVKENRYKYRLNALLLGAAVGAGFAAFESAGYAFEAGLRGGHIGYMIQSIQLRGFLSLCGSHMVYTAIAASAFWIARPYHKTTFETVLSPRFLKLFAVNVALHFAWNWPGELPFGLNGYFRCAVLGFIGWIVILSLVQSGLREVAALTAAKEADGTIAAVPGA
jgi:RsiW-degrading membrane proteinase PrsW (M82 family)